MSTGLITVTPTIALTAYTAGDVVGGLLTFSDNDVPVGAVAFNAVTLIEADIQNEQYVLHLFNDVPTTIANDAAYASNILIADLKKEIKQITIATADWTDTGTVGTSAFKTFDPVYAENPRNAIYGYLVATDTPDYSATDDLTINLHYVRL